MVFIRIFISVLLFLTVFIQPLAFVSLMEKIVYVGIVIPILLQKIWFGCWINPKDKKSFWINILFSILFIVASVFAIDVFLMMKDFVQVYDFTDKNTLLNIFLFMINRFLFFFAILYLWNDYSWGENHKILHYVFNTLRFFYTIVAVPVIIWLLYMLMINIAIV